MSNLDTDKVIEEIVMQSPLALLSVSNDLRAKINSFLPYSIGIELETSYKESYSNKINSHSYRHKGFEDIPFIMEDRSTDEEMRVRIPRGLKGLICLFLISERLRLICEFNDMSGIHYHVDTSDCYDKLKNEVCKSSSEPIREFILNELDREWPEKGNYNSRGMLVGGSWIRGNSEFKTFEFRIGEMTFDYKVLIKRIRHASSMIDYAKNAFQIPFQEVNEEIVTKEEKEQVLNFYLSQLDSDSMYKEARKKQLFEELAKLNQVSIELTTEQEKEILKNRVIKIKL